MTSNALSEQTKKDEEKIASAPGTVFGAPVPQPAPEDDDDELYPENLRGWLCWGVFQEYYRHNILVGTPSSVLGLLGSTQGGIGTLSSLFFGKLGDRYGYKRFTVIALVCSVTQLIGAAFSTKLWHFFLTQGVLQGLATGLCFPFILAYPAQWFKRRRGLATGIIAGGNYYPEADTICLVKEGPGRAAARAARGRVGWVDKKLLGDPVFWSVAMSLGLCVFGFFSPYFFMPTYVASRIPSLSPQYAVLPSSIMNFSSALGRSLIGLLADTIGPANAFMLAVLISALSQLLMWNFAYDYVVIMIFSVFFGATGGCFLSLMTPLAAQLFGTKNLAGLTGTFNFFMAPGNLAAAPIAGAVLASSGGNWHTLVSWSGGVQVIAIGVMIYARFKRQPVVFAKF
ncbi:hypothetical protein FRC09_008032 [Ceratobasidium sp. 395]|nr:hypothetical protein FRC09_008032 [Ceratobasidium sp. 395]